MAASQWPSSVSGEGTATLQAQDVPASDAQYLSSKMCEDMGLSTIDAEHVLSASNTPSEPATSSVTIEAGATGVAAETAETAEAVGGVAELEAQIEAQGAKVRGMKAAGASKDAILAEVEVLLTMKKQLPEGHALRPLSKEAEKQKQKENRSEQTKKRQKEEAARREKLKAREKEVTFPLIQRKIFHAMETLGSKDDFRYTSTLASEVSRQACWFTEKWDGTTMQATCEGLFKRYDNFGKGSTRKRKAKVTERYRLELVDLENPVNRLISIAVADHLPRFKALPPGMCVYFEALHSSIGATFKEVNGGEFAGIRVFDFSVDGEFLPFERTLQLAEELGFPAVHAELVSELTAEAAMERLKDIVVGGRTYADVSAPLEGFVVRGAGGATWAYKLRAECFARAWERKELGV